MSEIIIFSAIAGVVGTGVGGVLGAIIGKQNSKIISTILSLAGGVMLAVVFFDLIPESSRIYNHNIVVLLGLVWGIATMIFVEITDSGYIVYNIHNSWKDIKFNTTEYDMHTDLQPNYGHLVLSY